MEDFKKLASLLEEGMKEATAGDKGENSKEQSSSIRVDFL